MRKGWLGAALLFFLFAASREIYGITYITLPDYPGVGPHVTGYTGIDGELLLGSYKRSRGFLYDGTSFTLLPELPAPFPIDVRGFAAVSGPIVVGTYENSSGHHGFIYDGNTLTTLDHSEASRTANYGTTLRGVDDGRIVGHYTDNRGHSYSFVFDGSTFMPIDFPGSRVTTALGIDGNKIVGQYADELGNHGFIFDGTTYMTVDHPLADILPHSSNSLVDVSDNYMVGLYDNSLDFHSFLFDGVQFTAIEYPGAVETFVHAIDGDRIVGSYRIAVDGGTKSYPFMAIIPEPNTVVLASMAIVILASRALQIGPHSHRRTVSGASSLTARTARSRA